MSFLTKEWLHIWNVNIIMCKLRSTINGQSCAS